MKRSYSEAFKLEVVNYYYNSPFGVRLTARQFDLPSKNYITKWEADLKRKGLIPADAKKACKVNKPKKKEKPKPEKWDNRSKIEKEYEQRIRKMEAKIAYLESLEKLKPFLKKKRDPKSKV